MGERFQVPTNVLSGCAMGIDRCRSARWALLVILVVACRGWSQFEYRLDDGTGSVNIGPSQFSGQMLWGNYFEVEPGFDRIASISVAFGNIEVGRIVELLVFDDPDNDGDPGNAVLVDRSAGLTDLPRTNTFVDFGMNGGSVSGGFFVAALMDLDVAELPGRIDPQTRAGRSWLALDPGGIDLGAIGASQVYLNLEQNAAPGTFMVRAVGVPSGGAGVLGGAGAVLLLRRHRRARLD